MLSTQALHRMMDLLHGAMDLMHLRAVVFKTTIDGCRIALRLLVAHPTVTVGEKGRVPDAAGEVSCCTSCRVYTLQDGRMLQSIRVDAASGTKQELTLHRGPEDTPFTMYEARCLAQYHAAHIPSLVVLIDGPATPRPSPRQQEVLDELLQGRSEKEIAGRLGISVHTVHHHVRALYGRFGVHTRAELLSQQLGGG